MKTTGLTIQEAIQSGLPFKRENSNSYIFVHTVTSALFCENGNDFLLSKEDLLAQDWQIKPPEVTITREKLVDTYEKAYLSAYPIGTPDQKVIKNIIKELGL